MVFMKSFYQNLKRRLRFLVFAIIYHYYFFNSTLRFLERNEAKWWIESWHYHYHPLQIQSYIVGLYLIVKNMGFSALIDQIEYAYC